MVLVIRSRLKLMFFSLLSIGTVAYADVSERDADDYFEFLARANNYSPLEHAGSHGTIGIGIGLGLAGYETPSNSEAMRELWRGSGKAAEENKTPEGRLYIPRLQVHKGLPWSVDVGMGLGQDRLTGANLMSAYSQWTIFEGFALPALALRGGYNRLMGLASTDSSSVTVDAVASLGFLRIFTVYGSYGAGRHQSQVRLGETFGTSLVIDGASEGKIDRVMFRRSKSLGMQLQILPPFCVAAIESKQTGDGPVSMLAKISAGM